MSSSCACAALPPAYDLATAAPFHAPLVTDLTADVAEATPAALRHVFNESTLNLTEEHAGASSFAVVPSKPESANSAVVVQRVAKWLVLLFFLAGDPPRPLIATQNRPPTPPGVIFGLLVLFVPASRRLAQAVDGAYLAPLRLLALEGRDRLVARGVPCSLLTGEENVPAPGARAVSSTIEMVDTGTPIDVAVIDEAQMIFDPSRGWAWRATTSSTWPSRW